MAGEVLLLLLQWQPPVDTAPKSPLLSVAQDSLKISVAVPSHIVPCPVDRGQDGGSDMLSPRTTSQHSFIFQVVLIAQNGSCCPR